MVLPSYGPASSREAILGVARAAEESGFSSVWSTDHILVPKSQAAARGNVHECLTTLAYVAGVTERVRLGTSALVLPLRHSIIVAKEVATLDVLSGGRTILALGVGWLREESAFLGQDFHTRGRRMDEAIRLMRTLWAGGGEFHGRFWSFEDAAFGPRPAQVGGPPLWIAGNSAAALRRVATPGDAWHPTGMPAEPLRRRVEELRGLWGRARDLPVVMRVRLIPRGRPTAYRSLGERREALGGAPGEIAAALTSLEGAGLTGLVCSFEGADAQALVDQVRAFSREVIASYG